MGMPCSSPYSRPVSSLERAADLQPLEHRLFGGTGRAAIANEMHLVAPALERLLELGDALMSERGDDRVDALEDDRLGASRVLEIDDITIDAIEPRIGDHLDAELVQDASPAVAHVEGQPLTRMQPVDAEPHAAAGARQLLG